MRIVIAILEVDDDKAIEEDLGTIDYLEKESGWHNTNGISLRNARILDYDDEYDMEAIQLANKIFKEV